MAAIFTLSVMAIYAIGRIFFDYDIRILGVLGAIMSLVTVFTTSMIYAQLKSIPRWNTKLTPVYFYHCPWAVVHFWLAKLKFVFFSYHCRLISVDSLDKGDRALELSGTTIGSGTGLGTLGDVRALNRHTGTNYLLKNLFTLLVVIIPQS